MNEQGIIAKAIVWLFGANWKTSTSGLVTILSYFIHDKPVIIHWIPEPFQGIIWNVSEYIFVGGFLAFARQVKDKNVTGGVTQQTQTGAVAETTSTSVLETQASTAPEQPKGK